MPRIAFLVSKIFYLHACNQINIVMIPCKYFPFLVGTFFLFASCKTTHLTEIQPDQYRISGENVSQPDPETEALIGPYRDQLAAEMNQVIGEAAMDLTTGRTESTLGNWYADLLHERSEHYLGKSIDFAIMNSGGIRIPAIPKGPVTKGKIFELMPFDNMMVVVYLDKEHLLEMINHMAAGGGWPVSKTLRYKIREGVPENILLHEKPLADDKIYTVGVSDYLANGGGRCDYLVGQKREDLGVFMRDAIIEYIQLQTKEGKQLEASLDGRVQVLDEP